MKKNQTQRSKKAKTMSAYQKPAMKKKVVKKPSYISDAGKMLGGTIGGTFGPVGAGIGSFLGGKLGHLVEQVTGFGNYKIHANTVLSGGLSPPQIVNSVKSGGVIVRHREYIGDILGTKNFTNQSFLVQPGLVNTFPWLSQMANSFEQYRLRGMLFEFKSSSSDAVLSTATNSALGTVSMMTDYDVADAPPISKREMLNAEFSCSNKPSVSFIHPIECKRSVSAQNILYTRGALAVPDGFDQRLYDFCRFNIATEGQQADGGSIGELWVSYEIELLKPQFAFFGLTDHIRTTSATALLPYGTDTGTSLASGSTIGGTISADKLSYEFPPQMSNGKFYFSFSVVGPATANIVAADVTVVNAVLQGVLVNNTLGWINAPEPAATNAQAITIVTGVIRVTGENAKISLTASTGVYPATNNNDLWIIKIADSITQ